MEADLVKVLLKRRKGTTSAPTSTIPAAPVAPSALESEQLPPPAIPVAATPVAGPAEPGGDLLALVPTPAPAALPATPDRRKPKRGYVTTYSPGGRRHRTKSGIKQTSREACAVARAVKSSKAAKRTESTTLVEVKAFVSELQNKSQGRCGRMKVSLRKWCRKKMSHADDIEVDF